MKKYICKNNENGKYALTINKEYEATEVTEKWVYITNDKGNNSRYSIEFFEEVEDVINATIEISSITHDKIKFTVKDNKKSNKLNNIEIDSRIHTLNLNCCGVTELTNIHYTWNNIIKALSNYRNALPINIKMSTDLKELAINAFVKNIKEVSKNCQGNILIVTLVEKEERYSELCDIIVNNLHVESVTENLLNKNSENLLTLFLLNSSHF
jgi:dihydroorotate dehydrogenase